MTLTSFRKLNVIALLAATLLCQQAVSRDIPSTHGINVADIDPSIKPGDNFYAYAIGNWLKSAEIPSDRGSVGILQTTFDNGNKRMADLIAELAKSNAAAGSEQRKIADLYQSYMDEAALETRGLTPVRSRLDAIKALHDKRQLARALGETLRADVDALNNTNFYTPNLFGLWSAPGFSDSDHYFAYLMQGGLEMPDREYYLSDSENMKSVRAKYQAHIAAMLKLAGITEPEARAARIFALEHAIAEKHLSLADSLDVHKANNLWTVADLKSKAPGLDWSEYFAGAGLSGQKQFMVWQPTAFTAESALVASVPLEDWKDWMSFHLIEDYAGVLPKAFADERFSFFGTTLSGVSTQRPRWQRAVGIVNGTLPDAVGKIYAERYFSPEAKAQVQQMVTNIIAAFRKRVEALPWMAASTKAEALKKLSTLYVGVGYPESWHDYTGLEIKPDDLFGNSWRANEFEYHRAVSRLGAKVDKHEWSMAPQTVNAVNLPLQNALNFPAGFLQPPFFDPDAPAATNYGAIGTVIGHEVSHTFDSEGSAFDSEGRVRNWWTDADFAHFREATQKLVAQYDTYKPFADLSLNGRQTLAENIADVAGLAASYDAYRASLQGQNPPEKDGFNGDQQFFLAYAQTWQQKDRPDTLRQQILTDTHSPGEYRALTVRNEDPWYAAFGIKPEDKLYLAPDERVRIW
jgi:putative endopeptidase